MNTEELKKKWSELAEARNSYAQSINLGISNELSESQIERLLPELLKSYNEIILDMKAKAEFFKENALVESIEVQKQNKLTLRELDKQHDLFPNKREIEGLREIRTSRLKEPYTREIDELLRNKNALWEQLSYNDETLKIVDKHINKRKLFVEDILLRIERARFSMVQNLQYQNLDLARMVRKYEKTGDGSELLEAVRPLVKDSTVHPDLALVANKIIVQIIDAKRVFPKDYVADIKVLEADLKNNVEDFLSKMTDANGDYVISLVNLYQRVQDLRHHGISINGKFGETADRLGSELINDLSLFLEQTQGKKADQKRFNELKEIFTARLNSENDEMSIHRDIWKPIVANILIGLTTLGLALIVKYQLTGTLFFTKTKREEYIEEIGNSIDKVTLP